MAIALCLMFMIVASLALVTSQDSGLTGMNEMRTWNVSIMVPGGLNYNRLTQHQAVDISTWLTANNFSRYTIGLTAMEKYVRDLMVGLAFLCTTTFTCRCGALDTSSVYATRPPV